MQSLSENRAQSALIGGVLLFGILVIAASSWQAVIVTHQNEAVEFTHSIELRQQLTELRSSLLSMTGRASVRSTPVTLGARYPPRTVFVNPPPAAGTLRTVGTRTPAVNITIENAAVADTSGSSIDDGAGDFWNGTPVAYNTGQITYQPDYTYYQRAPRIGYEHSLLTERFADGTELPLTSQTLVRDTRITLVTINGSLSETRTDTATVDLVPISTRPQAVELTNTTRPIRLVFASRLSTDTWNETLADQLVANGGHVLNGGVTPVCDGPGSFSVLSLTLEPNQRYQLVAARVNLGAGATDTKPAYLTNIDGNGTTLRPGTGQSLTVELRDAFNTPQSGVPIAATATDGIRLTDRRVETEADGRATIRCVADNTSVGVHEVRLTVGETPPGVGYDGSTPTNLTVTVTVDPLASRSSTDHEHDHDRGRSRYARLALFTR